MTRTSRRYWDNTLILETRLETAGVGPRGVFTSSIKRAMDAQNLQPRPGRGRRQGVIDGGETGWRRQIPR